MKHRTIIVGGGSIGLCIAWELARRDHFVTLMDRAEVGHATSWAAAGILPPANFDTATDPIDKLRGLSHRMFPDWTSQLKEATGIDSGFRRCGGWYLANSPGEKASMIGMTQYWRELDIECERIANDEVARREPHLQNWLDRSPNASAWWTEDECQIRSPDYLDALIAACKKQNVELFSQTDVYDIDATDSKATVSANDLTIGESKTFESDSVIVCAGARTGLVSPTLRLQQALVPIRGQILLLKSDTPLLHGVVNMGHRYLVARDDGHVLVGSCEEEVGLELGTTPEMIDTLRDFAFDLCPELRNATVVRSWSGLRPMTFDGFPMIGRVPETSNVYVASGHYRSGLHLSPATAVVLADLMSGKKPAIDLDAFRVGKQQSSS